MHYSLFVAMVGIVAVGDAFSAVRIGNATKNQYYANQMAQYQAMNQVEPVNNDLSGQKNSVGSDTVPGVESQLDACSMIYPTGEFEIARPTAGLGVGGAKTCTAVVELYGYQMGENGSNAVLARANVAAGSSIKCNISDFPQSSYTLDAQRVVFPADAEPTVEDVKRVMNKEQKQNAGVKIAAAALVGAIGGNISGKNDAGKDGFMGTDKNKMQNTVIGALGGAAIGAGGAYGGYEAGNMIMSAGVNAVAGAAVGNMMASGDDVLRITKCKDANGNETTCLVGLLITGQKLEEVNDGQYYISLEENDSTVMKCDENNKNCEQVTNLVGIKVKVRDTDTAAKGINDLTKDDKDTLRSNACYLDNEKSEEDKKFSDVMICRGYSYNHAKEEKRYARIESAQRDEGRQSAVVANFEDSVFGKKRNDWIIWKGENSDAPIYKIERYEDGVIVSGDNLRNDETTLDNFYPMYVDANDGGIIDLGNKARLKSTVIGAGAGGALGAFVAYEGAQSDIDDRWVSAVREYKDSLQKFYCMTGGRFLSYYNDVVIIPSVKE